MISPHIFTSVPHVSGENQLCAKRLRIICLVHLWHIEPNLEAMLALACEQK